MKIFLGLILLVSLFCVSATVGVYEAGRSIKVSESNLLKGLSKKKGK